MSGSNRLCGALFVGLLLFASTQLAHATYPERAIKIICPYPVGSGTDVLSRFFARKLEVLAGQPVIVENRPGAATVLGTQAIMTSKPDGYTVALLSVFSLTLGPHLNKDVKYNAATDLIPVTTVFRTGSVVAVDAKSDMRTIKDLTAHLKRRGKAANFPASTTTGIVFAALYFDHEGLSDPVRVNYKSTPEAVSDLVGGNLDFAVADMPFGISQEKAGRIRLIATTSAQRSEAAPNLPTLAESGLPGVVLESYAGVFFPVGTPGDIQAKMAEWFSKIIAMPDTKAFLAPTGAEPLPGDAKLLAKLVKNDMAMFDIVSKKVDLAQ